MGGSQQEILALRGQRKCWKGTKGRRGEGTRGEQGGRRFQKKGWKKHSSTWVDDHREGGATIRSESLQEKLSSEKQPSLPTLAGGGGEQR